MVINVFIHVHVDCSMDDSDKLIGSNCSLLKQHMVEITHARGHTLDLIITHISHNISNVFVKVLGMVTGLCNSMGEFPNDHSIVKYDPP